MDDDEAVGFGGSASAGGDDGGSEDPEIRALQKAEREQKTAYVFCVDCRPRMFDASLSPVSGKTPMDLALAFISRFFRTMLRGNNDLVAITFYGTEHSKVRFGTYPNVYEFQTLEPVSPAGLNAISALDAAAVRELCGSMSDAEVRELRAGGGVDQVLWFSHYIFDTAKVLKGDDSHRVWLFTNDDDPYLGNAGGAGKAVGQARGLAAKQHDIFVFPIAPKATFDATRFWQPLIDEFATELAKKTKQPKDADLGGFMLPIDTGDMNSVIAETVEKTTPARRLTTIPLQLGGGVELNCAVYLPVLSAKKPNGIHIEAATNMPLAIVTRRLCTSTSSYLTPDLISTALAVGSDKVASNIVPMRAKEMETIQNFGPVGVTLLGFKRREAVIDVSLNVRPPMLIRPDEKKGAGATRAFNALVQAMMDKDVVGVARLIVRAKARPQLAALLPREEVLNELGRTDPPGGLWVVPLPFADDVRKPSFEDALERADPASVDLAKTLVESLRIPANEFFNPEKFENPVLQRFWSVVEDIACTSADNKIFDPAEDDTLQPPDDLVYNDQLVALCKEFGESYGGPGERPEKKSASSGGSRGPPKTKKIRYASDGTTVDFAAMHADGLLDSLSVDALKEYLRKHDLKLSGKKADLVARVAEHIDENAEAAAVGAEGDGAAADDDDDA